MALLPPVRARGGAKKNNMNIMIISTQKISDLKNKPEAYLDSDVKSINEIMDRLQKAGTPLSIQEAADLLCDVYRTILSIRQTAYQVAHSDLDLEESTEILQFAANLLAPTIDLKTMLEEKLKKELRESDACLSAAMETEDSAEEAESGEETADAEADSGEPEEKYIKDLVDLLEQYDLLDMTDGVSIEVIPAESEDQCRSIEVSAYVDGSKLDLPAIIPDADFIAGLFAILDKSGILGSTSGVQIIIENAK